MLCSCVAVTRLVHDLTSDIISYTSIKVTSITPYRASSITRWWSRRPIWALRSDGIPHRIPYWIPVWFLICRRGFWSGRWAGRSSRFGFGCRGRSFRWNVWFIPVVVVSFSSLVIILWYPEWLQSQDVWLPWRKQIVEVMLICYHTTQHCSLISEPSKG